MKLAGQGSENLQLTIKTRSAENNGDLKIGKYDSTEEGFPTLSSINYGTTPPAETSGSESGNGSSVGQGCGQYASAPCAVSIDDSAFANKDIGGVASAALADSNSKYDALQAKLDELSKDNLSQFSSDWLPRPNIAPGQCFPIPIHILNAKFSINICPWIALLSQAMGYLFYMFSALYIFRSFTNSSKD